MLPSVSLSSVSPIVPVSDGASSAVSSVAGAFTPAAVQPPQTQYAQVADDKPKKDTWWTPIAQLTEPDRRPLPADLPPNPRSLGGSFLPFITQLLAQSGQQSQDVMRTVLGGTTDGKPKDTGTIPQQVIASEDAAAAPAASSGTPNGGFVKGLQAYASAVTNVLRSAVTPQVQATT